jgi:hypothetical protein
MNSKLPLYATLGLCAALSACAVVPTGPSAMALPGSGKNFEQFRGDDYDCRQYADFQIGGKSASDAANESGLKSAAIGAGVGALAGAAIGGHQGAGSGAGVGLIVGSMAGAGAADNSSYGAQRRYDQAYIQCMYAKGNRVPVSGQFITAPSASAPAQSAPAAHIPPPPAGLPPPPPPGVR